MAELASKTDLLMEVKIMAYSSESCMVSEETAKKIRIKEIMTKERKEKLKRIFDNYIKAREEALQDGTGMPGAEG